VGPQVFFPRKSAPNPSKMRTSPPNNRPPRSPLGGFFFFSANHHSGKPPKMRLSPRKILAAGRAIFREKMLAGKFPLVSFLGCGKTVIRKNSSQPQYIRENFFYRPWRSAVRPERPPPQNAFARVKNTSKRPQPGVFWPPHATRPSLNSWPWGGAPVRQIVQIGSFLGQMGRSRAQIEGSGFFGLPCGANIFYAFNRPARWAGRRCPIGEGSKYRKAPGCGRRFFPPQPKKHMGHPKCSHAHLNGRGGGRRPVPFFKTGAPAAPGQASAPPPG